MNTEPKPTAAELLRGRIRRYFLTVLGLLAGAVVLVTLIAVAAKALAPDPKSAALVVGLAAPVVMLAVVGSSWLAVAKYWRCPACEKNVYWTVSWNMSVFAGAASRNCPHCNVELFTLQGRRRGLRFILLIAGICLGLGAAVGVLSSASRAKKQAPRVELSKPPG